VWVFGWSPTCSVRNHSAPRPVLGWGVFFGRNGSFCRNGRAPGVNFHRMHKVVTDMGKGFDVILDTASELEGVLKERQQTPDSAITALAMAMGKLCADYDIDLGLAQALVEIAYKERMKARHGGQA